MAKLPAPDATPPHIVLRVLSFNIRYGTASDGPDHWRHRRADVLQSIAAADPDVLGVQEAMHFQVEAIEELLSGHQRIGVSRDGAEGDEYSALFVDRSRLAVIESGTEWLGPTPSVAGSKGSDAALPRIVTWALVESTDSGQRMLMLNTHFDHRGSRSRALAAEQIAAMTRRFGHVPAVVMGDLNTGESSRPLQTLRDSGLRDSFRTVHAQQTTAGTYNGFADRRTGPKIDYVLYSEPFEVLDAWIDYTSTAAGRNVSDHYAVGAVLKLGISPSVRTDGTSRSGPGSSTR